MAIAEVQANGLKYLALATELLQRARLADAEAGQWEAADLQWWWRTPRRSDAIDQLFWIDDEGPVAGVVLTDWGSAWGCDLIVVPGVSDRAAIHRWGRALEAIDALGIEAVDVLVDDDDAELVNLLAGAGLVAGDEQDGTTWMDAEERPTSPLCRRDSFSSTVPWRRPDRIRCETETAKRSSPAPPVLALRPGTGPRRRDRRRPGRRLRALLVRSRDEVGMLEPMRVEDEFQRRGLARAMLTAGLERLASRGARRLKVSNATDAARSLYVGAGFRATSTSTS